MKIKLSKDIKKKDIITSWINHKKVLQKRLNLRWKKTYGIDQVMFSLFFGGNEPSWATKKEEKVYFRKFVISGN